MRVYSVTGSGPVARGVSATGGVVAAPAPVMEEPVEGLAANGLPDAQSRSASPVPNQPPVASEGFALDARSRGVRPGIVPMPAVPLSVLLAAPPLDQSGFLHPLFNVPMARLGWQASLPQALHAQALAALPIVRWVPSSEPLSGGVAPSVRSESAVSHGKRSRALADAASEDAVPADSGGRKGADVGSASKRRAVAVPNMLGAAALAPVPPPSNAMAAGQTAAARGEAAQPDPGRHDVVQMLAMNGPEDAAPLLDGMIARYEATGAAGAERMAMLDRPAILDTLYAELRRHATANLPSHASDSAAIGVRLARGLMNQGMKPTLDPEGRVRLLRPAAQVPRLREVVPAVQPKP